MSPEPTEAAAPSAPGSAPEVHLDFDLKSFLVASFPSDWVVGPRIPPALEPLLPDGFDRDTLAEAFAAQPFGQGIGAGRVRFQVKSDRLSFLVHHEVATLGAGSPGIAGLSSGVARTAPELVDLTWEAETGDALTIRGRTDRLSLAWAADGAKLTIGRQPVSFGTGLVFAPMDVVNPFSAATIDTEYKPGVDAVRFDVFAGTAGKATLVGAWAGALPPYAADADPVDAGDVVVALSGQGTLGVTDVIGLAGLVRGDVVGGVGFVSALGPVGIHGDATLTLPAEDALEDAPFVRAVVGADGRPTPKTTISGEAYLQTNGADAPAGYLAFASGPRFARGELWTMGRHYGALTVAQEVTALVSGSAALIANLADPSALLAPGLTVSVSDDVTVGAGGYLALGARPDTVPAVLDPATFSVSPPATAELARSVNSEFGLYPHAFFLQMKAWF